MISYVENKNIDRKRWDDVIDNSANGIIFSYSWFLDITAQHWDALIEDDYKSVFPLPWNKKYSYPYIHQPLFSNQLGVFSKSNINEEKVNAFLKNIPAHFRYVDLGLNYQNKTSADGYKINERKVQFVNLNKNYDELRKQYDGNLKRNLRKAESAGISIRAGVKPEDVTHYFRSGRGNELGHFSESDYEALNRLQHTAIENKSCFTLGGYTKSDHLIAAASFLKSHDRIIFLKGAPSSGGREAGAMHCIMDYVIQKYSEKNILFDFGGSVIPNLARFYKSFGAEDYLYLHVKRNLLPFYIRWLKK